MPPRRAAAIKAARPLTNVDIESEDDDLSGDDSEDGRVESEMDIDDPESEDEADDDDVNILESEDDPEGEPTLNAAGSPHRVPTTNNYQRPKSGPAGGSAAARPTLKVKLKLGARPTRLPTSAVVSSAASATPEPEIVPGRRTGKRAIIYDEEDDLDELETQSVQSSSRMTARQAALATGLGAEHVQLPLARKKKVMTQAEIAARRSESAIKRKHLTEKKLEDDKTETINRLLKKQSAGTRRKKALEEAQANGEDAQGGPSGNSRQNVSLRPSVPSFRWISTSRKPVVVITEGDSPNRTVDGPSQLTAANEPPKVTFTFSIPSEFLPPVPNPPSPPPQSLEGSQIALLGADS